MKLYKATNPDGFDFRTRTIDYAGSLATGEVITHPTSREIVRNQPKTYLSVSVEPAETLIGGSWPARLFLVEAVGDVVADLHISKHKRAVLGLKVIEELPSWMALGPNGQDVVSLIERARTLTIDEVRRMNAAWGTARDAAWNAARNAARDAAWNAARDAAWNAARDAARDAALDAALGAARDAARDAALDAVRDVTWATVVRDLIPAEHYDTLMASWRAGVGEWK